MGCSSTGRPAAGWEYKILQTVQRGDVSDSERKLNELAREGWVLVSESTSGEGAPLHTFVLKRAVKP